MNTNSLKSPIDGNEMEAVTLAQGLRAFRCKSSGGHYIPAASYMQWLEKQPARLDHLPQSEGSCVPDHDSTRVLFCPESGTLMTRCKVGHGFSFAIDRSITGGIWLDAGEWDALRQRNFHDEIHLVFTAPWQQHVRDQRADAVYRERLENSLGTELLGDLEKLREQLVQQPHQNRALALAFLAGSARENQ